MYSQTGNYVAAAGLIVLILNHFHLAVAQSDVEEVIGAVIAIYGVARQYIAHKSLGAVVGAVK